MTPPSPFPESWDGGSGPDLQRTIIAENTQGFQLAAQGRPLHPYKGRGSRDIAAKPGDLGNEIFPLENLSRVAPRQGHDFAALVPFHDGRSDRSDLVREHIGAQRLPRVAPGHDQEPVDDVAQ